MSTPTAYPLHWPAKFPRTRVREAGRFKSTLPSALKNVQHSLAAFARDSGKKLESLVISSNVTLGDSRPKDTGVAIWFVWDGLQVCIPVDRYTAVEANLQAIHHIVEARRTELRHGTLALVHATFQGFLALPEQASARAWWDVFGFPDRSAITLEEVTAAYRVAAKIYHPDGTRPDPARWQTIVTAYEQARQHFTPATA